jgi:hypothetical protein
MHRILNTNVLGMILAVLSCAGIALIVYMFLKVIEAGTGWIYLD